ncbi:MAG TPA: hypothetical protein VK673_08950, partial [Chthoniobacterales bacterium]|nr:hypothetical protein [Chthoniobacterales bacterium]
MLRHTPVPHNAALAIGYWLLTILTVSLVRSRREVMKKLHELGRLAGEKSVRSQSTDCSHRSPLISVGRTMEQTGKLRLRNGQGSG